MSTRETELLAERHRILLIGGEAILIQSIRERLAGGRFNVETAQTPDSGLRVLMEKETPLALVADASDWNGADPVGRIRRWCPATEVIVLAGSESEDATNGICSQAFDVVRPDLPAEDLRRKILRALEYQQARREVALLRQHVAMNYGFDNIIGCSEAVTNIRETGRRLAATDITILITGQSGTGKEHLARAIHHHSQRRHQPFVVVDCHVVPERSFGSLLFGDDETAPPAARLSDPTLLQQADGGTVFFDHVECLPESAQLRLQRFLQSQTVWDRYARDLDKLDIRVLAASTRDLAAMTAEGSFREDLYYLLNVIPLHLPPLVERREDVDLLAINYLRTLAGESGSPALALSRTAREKLLSYSWPGNIRELENTLRRAAALCAGDLIQAEDVMFVVSHRLSGLSTSRPQPGDGDTGEGLLVDSQRNLIESALEENNWNFTQTALDLGIGRTTLWRKVKRFNLKRPPEVSLKAQRGI